MKKNVLTLLFCLSAMAAFNTNSNGQTLIHYWNFNSFTSVMYTPTITAIPADYSVGSLAASLLDRPIAGTSSSYSTYCDFVAGDASDTVNARMGAASGNGLRARNPNDSMELILYIPSTGYNHLVLTYSAQSSSYTSGDSVQLFAYSVDSGATWITSGSGLSEWVDSAKLIFTRITIAINDPSANNNRKLLFRIRTAGRNTGTSGNNRYDNISLDGTSVTEVAEVAQSIFTLYPNPVTNNLEISADLDGVKSVRVLNSVGQTVYTGSEDGRHFSINTANLNKGNYFISIRDNTGKVNTMKFAKL